MRETAMNADSIQYALETDCPLGAAGFETLHLEIRSAELHPASTGFRRRSGAPLIRDAQVRVPPPALRVFANSDLICRGSSPAAPASQSGLCGLHRSRCQISSLGRSAGCRSAAPRTFFAEWVQTWSAAPDSEVFHARLCQVISPRVRTFSDL